MLSAFSEIELDSMILDAVKELSCKPEVAILDKKAVAE
jgi:hypothetical protein